MIKDENKSFSQWMIRDFNQITKMTINEHLDNASIIV